jgi:hypothetical protein
MNAFFVGIGVCAIIYLFPSNTTLQRDFSAEYPLRSIALIQPSWRTLNSVELGGMMDLNSKPTYLDTRLDTFEHHGELADYLKVINSRKPLDLLDKYHIDHLLIPASWPLSDLLEHTPGWQVEMRENARGNVYELITKAPNAAGEQFQCAANSAADRQ